MKPPGIVVRQSEKAGTDFFMKIHGFQFQTVTFPRIPVPLKPLSHIEVTENGQVGAETSCCNRIHRIEEFTGNSPAESLIRNRRVREAVADDDGARRKRRAYFLSKMLGARCCVQKQFSGGVHIGMLGIEQKSSDPVADECSSRFVRCDDFNACGSESGGEQFRLGAFAASLDAFKRDEDAAFPVCAHEWLTRNLSVCTDVKK